MPMKPLGEMTVSDIMYGLQALKNWLSTILTDIDRQVWQKIFLEKILMEYWCGIVMQPTMKSGKIVSPASPIL